MADLINRLHSEARQFNFFQAVSLLEEWMQKNRGAGDALDDGRLRFAPDRSILFPSSDVSAIEQTPEGVRLVLAFMGLTGATSPLPQYFSQYVQQHEEDDGALYDFLAMFNHRVYALFYRAWKKYHFMRNFTSSGTDPFSRKVAALAGITAAQIQADPVRLRMLAYTGVLAGACRSSSGLSTVIADFFDGIPVTIEQWTPRWAEVPAPAALGRDSRLGFNALAGTRVRDRAGKFRVVVGPLKRTLYETFLPGSQNIAMMQDLVRGFLADPLEFDVEVKLQSIDLVPVVLGANTAYLGTTSSLGRSDRKSGVQSVIIE